MILNQKILVVIPARGGSKGIKLKNLRKIIKKSLLKITIDFSKSLKFVDEITVSSEHAQILNIAKKNGLNLTKRNKKLSGDRISDFKVLRHAIYNIERKKNCKFDIIIYLQPTSPFRKLKDIKKAINIMLKKKYDSVWSVTKASLKFHPKKVLKINQNKKLKLFQKSGENIVARQELSNIFIRNGIFYIFKRKKLLNEKKIYLKNIYPYLIKHEYVNIDNKEYLIKSKLLALKKNYNF